MHIAAIERDTDLTEVAKLGTDIGSVETDGPITNAYNESNN